MPTQYGCLSINITMKKRTIFFCLLWAAMFSCTQAMGENLLVYDADTSEEIDVKTKMYSRGDCLHFLNTNFDRGNLPKDLGVEKDEPAVERPDFNLFELAGTLNKFDNNEESLLRPGMTVSWGEPVSKLAKQRVKGYLLVWRNDDWDQAGGMTCRLFKVENSEFKLKFKYEIEFLPDSYNFEVRVYSLPPPSTFEEGNNRNNFVSLNITTGTTIRDFKDPGTWVPSISVKHGESSITVTIVNAPMQFKFTAFDVMLLRYHKDQFNPIEIKRYVAQPYSAKKSSGFVTFTGLTVSDDYRVVVQVIDPFPNSDERCLCYLTERNGRLCEASCGSIASQWAPLGFKEDPVENTTVFSDEISGMGMAGRLTEPVESKKGMNDAIVSAIVATCTTLALAFLILSILFLTQRNKNQSEVIVPHAKEILSVPGDIKGPLESQTVYIVYAEDHPEHMKVVENFATFLSAHGNCNVIFPHWQDINCEGITQWSTYALERADHLLFIDSVAAERLLSGFNVRRVYVPTKPLTSHCNQLLRLARDHVYNVPGTKDRVRVVHFRKDCGSQRFLAAPHMFHLPSRLPELLQCIHGLSTKQAKALNYKLPVDMDCSKYFEGASLLASIKASAEYEDSHPNWFEKRYGRARLEFQTHASERVWETNI